MKPQSQPVRQARPFSITHFWVLLVLVSLPIVFFPGSSFAQSTKTIGDQFAILKNVPGLSHLPVTNIKMSGKATSADITLRGKSATVLGFKSKGASMAAVVIEKLKLTDLVPIPKGTPIDGVSLNDMALIYVPKGHAKKNIPTHSFPSAVKTALGHSGTSISLKEGINLFGQGNVSSSDSIKKVLKLVGFDSFTLPLSGVFPSDLFKHDLKNASQKLKDQLLTSLNLSLPLPTDLNIHGMPKIVKVSSAKLIVVGREVKGKHDLFAGVTGEFNVKVGSKSEAFSFGILAGKPGKKLKAEITGSSTDTIHLPFFHPLDITKMNLVANKAHGKWDVVLDGKATLKGKTVDVAIHHDPTKGNTAKVTGAIRLADLLPGGVSIPGITDIEFDEMDVSKNFLEVKGKVKNIDTVIAVFKRNGKTLVAINTPKDLKLSNLIPQAKGTPIDAESLQHMNYIWVPRGGAQNNVPLTDFPHDISTQLGDVVRTVDLKEGLNVIGQLAIQANSSIGKMLKKVNAYRTSYPLVGKLSPKMFKKGNTAQIKKEILNDLDIQSALPNLSLPGLPNAIKINSSHFAIKGHEGGIDVGVKGEMIAKMGSSNVDFDFDFKIVKEGNKTNLALKGTTHPGTKATISMVETFQLSEMSFNASKNLKSGAKWFWTINATSSLHNNPVSLQFVNNPAFSSPYLNISTKMTLAKAIGKSSLPGLDDVEMEWINFQKKTMTMAMKIDGIPTNVEVFKPQGASKYNLALSTGDFSPDKFIPGSANTPLKDVTFKKLGFLYNPGAARTAKHADMPFKIGSAISGDIKLKTGLNVFGHMDIHPMGEIASLLGKVHVTDLNLPLNGTFSPKAFSKNHASIKNEILDNLDININLPTPSIPGLSKIITFTNGHLKVKGKQNKQHQREIDIAVSGDADVHIKNKQLSFFLDVERDKSPGSTDIKITGHNETTWTHPFGINWLVLDTLTLDIDKKTVGEKSSWDIDINAKTNVGSHSHLDVRVDVHEVNGVVTDAFFELDGPINLSDIPGAKEIPNSSHFTIDTIKVSEHGIEAKTDFGGKKDLDIFLFDSNGWNMILRQDHFAITELVPPLNNTPLKHIILSEAAMVISKSGIKGPLTSFGTIAKDGLKDIFGSTTANIDVKSGLNLIAAFEHKNAGGKVAGALRRMGMTEERVIMTGDIGGLFGGPASLNIDVDLSAHGPAHNQPQWMKSKPGVTAVFSMIATETEGQFDIEIGIGVDITAKVHGTELDFTAKTALEFEDEKIDIKIVAELQDRNGWRHPFGIPGFTLKEVGLDLGLDEDGAIHLGFDGNIEVSGSTYKMAADADLLPEALGAPQDIAFVGTADKVDMFFVEELAMAIVGANFKLGLPSGILPDFTNVAFAFVTPGAADADLKKALNLPANSPLNVTLTSEGMVLAGGMNWLDHELGSMIVEVGPQKGIYAHAEIDDLDLGPLTLKNNDFTMDIALTGLPTLRVDSDIELLGIKEKFTVDFDKTGATLDANISLGPDIDLIADLGLKGLDLSMKKPDFKNADFSIDADLTFDIGKLVGGPAKKALKEIQHVLTAAFATGKEDVDNAQHSVDHLSDRINAERARIRRERAAAEKRLHSAQDRVDSLQNTINADWRAYHHCHGWFSKWPCRIEKAIEVGVIEVAKVVADEALRLAETLVAHFPLDLDPRIAGLIFAKDVATGVLNVAKAAIAGLDVLDRVMDAIISTVIHEITNSVNIHKASFQADLKGVIEHDQPVRLAIDAEFFGANVKEAVAFKLKDITYSIERLALLGYYALHHLVEKGIHDMPAPLEHKLRGAIGGRFLKARHANQAELTKHGLTVDADNPAADRISADYRAFNLKFLKANMNKLESTLDQAVSETFSNKLIEVGHSGLCLVNDKGLVKQHTCTTNNPDRKWTTKPITGAPGVKDGLGYVQLTQAGSNKCVSPEGSWASVVVTHTNPKHPEEKITFTQQQFSGNGKIAINTCANTKKFYWKMLKHGDGWMQIANMATKKCLHFSDSSALPGAAQAEWQSCTGSANQVFRVADKATPVYHADNIALKNDQLGLCLGEANRDSTVPMADCNHAARYDYMVDIRGYVKFINRASGKCLQPSGYGFNTNMIEKTCTQLDYQWWNPNIQAGGIIIQNAQTGHCTVPPLTRRMVPPTQVRCTQRKNAVFAPVQNPNSGLSWAIATPGTLHKFPNNIRIGNGPGAYLCTFPTGGSYYPGTTDDVGSQTADNIRNTCNVTLTNGSLARSKGEYRLGTHADNTEWVQNDGHLHWAYVPVGGNGNSASLPTMFLCKSHRNVWGNLGWTVDGILCHTTSYETNPIVSRFKVLARTQEAFYALKIGSSRLTHNGIVPANLAEPVPQPVKWSPFGGEYGGPTFTQDGDIVTITGFIQGGDNYDPVLTVPAGMAPPHRLVFNSKFRDTELRLDIMTNGQIVGEGDFSANSAYKGRQRWLILSGLSYGLKNGKPLTLASGWKLSGSSFSPPVATKSGNRVVVNGLLNPLSGDYGPGQTHVATLPVGMRPPGRMAFNVNNNGKVAELDVFANGEIHWMGGGHGGWLTLDGIIFSTKPTRDLPLPNGWIAYPGYAKPTISRQGNMVTISGYLKNTGGKWDQLAILPKGYRPPKTILFGVSAYDHTNQVDAKPSGEIIWSSGKKPHGSISLAGITYETNDPLPPELQPLIPWEPYGGEYGDPTYSQDGDIVTVTGMIQGGNKYDSVWTIPKNVAPPVGLLFNSGFNATPLRMQVYPTGKIAANGNMQVQKDVPLANRWLPLSFSYGLKNGKPLKLASGWSSFGSGFSPPVATKSGNRVVVNGLLKAPGGKFGPNQTHVATLPAGMRPPGRLTFNVNNGEKSAEVDVMPNGDIYWIAGGHGHGWLSLDGIVFSTKPTGDLPLANGWVAYAKGNALPTISRQGNMVTVSGLIKQKQKSDKWGELAMLPKGYRPPKRLVFYVNNYDKSSRVDVFPTGEIKWVSGGKDNGWVSLAGITFATQEPLPSKLQPRIPWEPYGGEYGAPTYSQDGDIVTVTGMIQGGNKYDSVWTIPKNVAPPVGLLFNSGFNATPLRMQVFPTGKIAANGNMQVQKDVPLANRWLPLSFSYGLKNGKPLTLASGWSSFGSGFSPPVATKSGNRVVVNGLLKAPGGKYGPKQTHVATLPVGMRPPGRLSFNVNNHDKSAEVDVMPNGDIYWIAGGHGHGWLSLDGIVFSTKPTGDLPLANGWVAYAKGNALPTISRQGNMVTVSGLIKQKQKSDKWGELAMLPKGYRPPKRLVFYVNNYAKSSRVDVFPTGEIKWVAGGKDYGWISLGGITFATNEPAPPVNKWKKVAGHLIDIGAGANGSVWGINADKSISSWTGTTWKKVSGCAKRIDVGPQGHPWVIDCDNALSQWNGSSWIKSPGKTGTDVGVGADGTVWLITDKKQFGGYTIERFKDKRWENINGAAVRIDVDNKGNAWVTQESAGKIWHWNGSRWTRISGQGIDIGSGADGTVVVISKDGTPYKRDGERWEVIAGGHGFENITVDKDGNPWALNKNTNEVHTWGDAGNAKAAHLDK